MVKVDLQELETAVDWVSSGLLENRAFISRETGEIFWDSDEVGLDDKELPDDIEDGTKYIAVPDKRDLDLGSVLVFEFVAEAIPEDSEKVRQMFRRRGAYGRFKDLLERRNILQRWYDYQNRREREALAQWCRDHGFEPEG